MRLERPLFGGVGGGDGVGDALGQLGGEAVAREVDEHGDPRSDRLGHLEDADELALLEPDDRRHEPGQGGRFELEDEIARQVLEHRARRPPGVRVDAARR